MKVCTTCQEVKESTEFNNDKSRVDGLDARCKSCRSELNRKYKREYAPDPNLKEQECRKCGKVKPIEQFYKSKTYRTGYATGCKECHNTAGRARTASSNPSYTTKEAERKPNTKQWDVYEYERGTNEILERMLAPKDRVWIVNGNAGRRPLLANSKQEAIDAYARFLERGSKIEE